MIPGWISNSNICWIGWINQRIKYTNTCTHAHLHTCMCEDTQSFVKFSILSPRKSYCSKSCALVAVYPRRGTQPLNWADGASEHLKPLCHTPEVHPEVHLEVYLSAQTSIPVCNDSWQSWPHLSCLKGGNHVWPGSVAQWLMMSVQSEV